MAVVTQLKAKSLIGPGGGTWEDVMHLTVTRAGDDLLGKLSRALYTEAELIKAKSVNDTPVESGALRGSHRVLKPVIKNQNEIVVEIRVGGPSPGFKPVHYAVYVHERLELHHPVGKAKFLEDQVHAAQDGFAERIASRMNA